jgi:hypothetical protein
MHIEMNGTRLWFDVDGPGLVPDGSEMRPDRFWSALTSFLGSVTDAHPPVRASTADAV